MTPTKKTATRIKLRPGLEIGKAAAENDDEFLYECFLATGHYQQAINPRDSRFLVVGRTGAGKTALLKMIEHNKSHVIRVDPMDLSLEHLSNLDIIQFITGLGLRIDPFLEMLWRYTFSVELLRARYSITDHETAKTRLFSFIKTKRTRAIDLLRGLSSEFWKTVDVRVSEATRKLERDVKGALTGEFAGVNLSAEGAKKLTEEQRLNVQQRVNRVIGQDTLSALQEVIHFLAEDVFDDDQNPYYVIIDDLDREFAESDIKARLIKTLIESVIRMRPVRNVKFVVGVRADVLELVLETTRDASFQQEKFEDCFLHLRWSNDDLYDVLNRRINFLFKKEYTKDAVRFQDIFASEVNRTPTREYILERTLSRPRDAIQFTNECLRDAQQSPSVTPNNVKTAEARYSTGRFNSLRDEWHVLYPAMDRFVAPLRGKPAAIRFGDITFEEIEDLFVLLADADLPHDKLVSVAARELAKSNPDLDRFKRHWGEALYKIGIIGVKHAAHLSVLWGYKDITQINESHFHDDSRIYVHKMLWHELGTRLHH